jgi:GTP-binding protein
MTDETAPVSTTEVDPLVIRYLDFLGPQVTKDGWRPENELPEVAFAGRSNVGKSSLLNVLLRRKALARVSNTPGRTRQINFFSVNRHFVLADLPGYGYAKISKARKAEWKPLIEGYIKSSTRLAGVVLLLDVRHDPSPDDLQMLDFLADVGVPTIVVATKTDKLGALALEEHLTSLTNMLGLDPEQLVAFSSRTGEGRNTLAIALNDLLAQPSWRVSEADVEDSESASGDTVNGEPSAMPDEIARHATDVDHHVDSDANA